MQLSDGSKKIWNLYETFRAHSSPPARLGAWENKPPDYADYGGGATPSNAHCSPERYWLNTGNLSDLRWISISTSMTTDLSHECGHWRNRLCLTPPTERLTRRMRDAFKAGDIGRDVSTSCVSPMTSLRWATCHSLMRCSSWVIISLMTMSSAAYLSWSMSLTMDPLTEIGTVEHFLYSTRYQWSRSSYSVHSGCLTW